MSASFLSINNMRKSQLFIILFVLILLITVFLGNRDIDKKQSEVCFNDNCFYVELSETPEQKSQGLMFREKLDLNKGMLFIFKKEGIYPFWMKNTLISLDIIWIDKNKEVVFISQDVEPCSINECKSIIPDKKALYVLEINKGLSDEIGLTIGSKLNFGF